MDYIKKRTHIINHPRFANAGAHARDLYDWGLLHCGLLETDGEIAMVSVLDSSWGYGGKANVKAATRLVEVGLWERTDLGYRVLKWSEQGNMTKADLQAKRAHDREKKRKQRLGPKSEVCPPGVPRPLSEGIGTCTSTSLSDLDLGEGESAREGDQPTENSEVRPSMLRYSEAYCRGVAAGKGAPYAWPGHKYAEWDLGKAIATFAKRRSTGEALRGEKLIAWIEAAADDFASWVVKSGDAPKFWSNFDPKGFVRFLNQEAQAEEARRVG